MSGGRRLAVLVPLLVAVAAYVLVAVLAYREEASPRQQVRAARRAVGQAFTALESSSGSAASEIDAFAGRLRYAQSLYRSAALTDVLGGEAVLGLAATECELGQIVHAEGERCLALLELATDREPRNGTYQLRVADAWFRTGHPERGSRIASRAVELNPVTTSRALRLLTNYGLTPAASVDALGRRPEVLAAARDHFTRSEKAEDFLDLAESALASCSSDLFETYGDTAIRLRRSDRIVAHLESAAGCQDPESEAVRLRILGQALLVEGRIEDAAAAAATASALRPGEPRITELRGDCHVAAARPGEGAASYRAALREAAQGSASRGQRARLYRKLGQCFEAMGEGGRAFDAYTKSLELNPNDPVGQARLRELTRRPVGTRR